MVCVSRVFVYNAVDINKIVAISSTIPPSYTYAQVTAGLKLYLGWSANPLSAKFQLCRLIQMDVMAANASACSLFLV